MPTFSTELRIQLFIGFALGAAILVPFGWQLARAIFEVLFPIPVVDPVIPSRKVDEDDWKRAFEIHKNCDQMLHQRLASFTALQAFTIAAYMALTIARFQTGVAPERIFWFEISRVGLIAFGIVSAVFGWMVTFPMLVRLRYLDAEYLNSSPIYLNYIALAHDDERFNKVIASNQKLDMFLARFWRNYRHVIPLYLPAAEIMLWCLFLIALGGAWVSTWIAGAPGVTPQ